MNQKEFENKVKMFEKIEDARDQLWGRALVLIEKGLEMESYILILATWNFARFRYFMKKFDLRNFKEVINNINPIFRRLKNKKFEEVNFNDSSLVKDIKFIYSELKRIAEQTGATKIMALKNSNLFIMWDTEIRRIYKINNKAEPEDYIKFLLMMRKNFEGIKWDDKKTPFAKAIDEYNYVLAEKNREIRKDKKSAK